MTMEKFNKRQNNIFLTYRRTDARVLSAYNFGSLGQIQIALEAEFSSWVYDASLHRAFIITLSSSWYDLNNVERDV